MNITEIIATKQEKNDIIRLAPYCRVSSDSTDQLHSFAAQIRYYTELAKNNPRYQLVDIYADEGITGTSMKNRDDLNRLIRDCLNGKVDRVIVKSVSRLARNTEELLSILRLLKSHNVSVFFEEQGIDTEKMNMEMIVTFPGIAAQQESENISGNVRWSIKKRMESGEYLGVHAPFGYRFVNGSLVINKKEAAIVIRIFDMFLSGIGKQSIANMLNDEGIKKSNVNGESRWYYDTINYILENERYKGDALLQKQFVTDTLPYRQVRNKGQKPQYYVENSNPAIISKEKFDAAQKLIHERRFQDRKKSDPSILSGMIKCPYCGGSFRRQIILGKEHWGCSLSMTGRSKCKSIRLTDDDVKDTFIIMSLKLKDNYEALISHGIRELEKLFSVTSTSQATIYSIDKEIADLSARNHVISQLYTKRILNFSEYTSQTSELNAKITELRSNRKKILCDNKENKIIDQLNTLCEIINVTDIEPEFNCDLFTEIVEKVIANDDSAITFYLIGGVRFTEQLSIRKDK